MRVAVVLVSLAAWCVVASAGVGRSLDGLLHRAAAAGDVDGVAALLSAGVDVGARDAEGLTALHVAAARGRGAVVQLLLKAGGDAGALDDAGRSPLVWAVDHGACRIEHDAGIRKIAEMLVGAGAAIDAKGEFGRSVLSLAIANGHEMTADYLRTVGAVESAPVDLRKTVAGYPTLAEIEQTIDDAAAHPAGIAQRDMVGISGSIPGRMISAVRIGDEDAVVPGSGGMPEPAVLLVSTMHGDEPVGTDMLRRLIDDLMAGYGTDTRITAIVDSVDLWLVPVMNPDGYEAVTRWNASGVDLNRDFPGWFNSPLNSGYTRQQETAAMIAWSADKRFALSANFHTGALVANYPFDSNATGQSIYSASDDDDVMIYISRAYADNNPTMASSTIFPGGISNGADWYHVYGGMQDWRYRYAGTPEVTMEIAGNKRPSSSQLPVYWSNNRESLLSYIEASLIGLAGVVSGADGAVPDATVDIIGRAFGGARVDPATGSYSRLLLPGTYGVRVSAPGYIDEVVSGVSIGSRTRLDVMLEPDARLVSPDGGASVGVGVASEVVFSPRAGSAHEVQYTPDPEALTERLDSFDGPAFGDSYRLEGLAPWSWTASGFSGGGVRSAPISDAFDSSFAVEVEGPGTLAFRYRVSSEASYDFFTVRIDGQPVLDRSGNVGWTAFTMPIGAGPHLVEFTYRKDFSVSSGEDAAFVDELRVMRRGADWRPVGTAAVGEDRVLWTPTEAGDSYAVRVRAVPAGSEPGAWSESAVFSVVAGVPCSGADLAEPFGAVDAADALSYLSAFEAGSASDFDGVTGLDFFDVLGFLTESDAGCP